MLKVLHTGDWHIGSFPGPEVGGQNARFQDICRCLDFQAMYAEEHRPDLIVVSGDIFHQARVWSDRGLRESRTAIDHIRRLSNVAPTVVLRGTPNHDSEEQFEMLTTAFYGDDSVSVVTEPEVIHIHTYHGQRVDVACIPGFDRGVHRAAHPGLSREEETQVFTDELAKVVLGLKAQCEPGVTSIGDSTMRDDGMFCPYKKSTKREVSYSWISRTEITTERFGWCSEKKCMAYEDGRCKRLEREGAQ